MPASWRPSTIFGRSAVNGVETVALRYFNVFGPGQDPHSEYAAVVPRFVTSVLGGRQPTVNGTGEVSRDFTYIDNVVEANLAGGRAEAPGGRLTCNVACGDRHSLLELLGGRSGRRPASAIEPVFEAPRAGDILHSCADISLARTVLGYDVEVSFADGIRRTVEWYRDVAAGAPRGG